MSFNYNPLWKILIDKSMKKLDLVEQIGISRSTLAKLSKNEYVSMEVLDKICKHFKCQVSDIVEHVSNT